MNSKKLYALLKQHFDQNELMDLCFHLDLPYEDLDGNNRAAKIRELIQYCERREFICNLLKKCQDLRPYANWEEVLPEKDLKFTLPKYSLISINEEAKFSHTTPVWNIAFSPNGHHLATASRDGISLWDLRMKIREEIVHKSEFEASETEGGYIAYDSSKEQFAFSEGWNIYLGKTKIIQRRKWDLGFGQPSGVRRLLFSTDGNLLISSWVDGKIIFWNIDQEIERSIDIQGVIDIDISPDNKYLAIVGEKKQISLVNMVTLDLVPPLFSDGKGINCVRFSPDGRFLAYTSGWSIFLMDIANPEEKKRFVGHKGIIKRVTYNPSGALIASASIDKTIRLWEVHTGQEIIEPIYHEGVVHSVGFSTNGKFMASACEDHQVRLWKLS